MELVRGVGLLRWVRPYEDLPYDEARLRTPFAQLADGLAALHARGLVHRDIKPSNALVTDGGRVVVLDFGLVTETTAPGDDVVGSPAYRAPEQTRGAVVGAAADWYALGAALYEALTGQLPDHVGDVAPSPRALVPGVAEDLDALCRELLDRDPTRRPAGAEVLRRLGVTDVPAVEARGALRRSRRRAGGAAGRLFASRTRTVALLLHGESGVGKSALVRRFVDELVARAPDAVVLAGRCYERESVHYKAVDGAIDALTDWLSSQRPDEVAALLPREMALAGELFPVPGMRVDAIAGAAALEHAPEDPPELRNRAFAALRAPSPPSPRSGRWSSCSTICSGPMPIRAGAARRASARAQRRRGCSSSRPCAPPTPPRRPSWPGSSAPKCASCHWRRCSSTRRASSPPSSSVAPKARGRCRRR